MASGYEKSPDYGGPEPNLKRLVIVAVLIVAVIILWFVVPAFSQVERHYQDLFCKGMRTEVTTPSGARADCVSNEYAIELGFSESWAESIGQALHYAAELDRKPGIILVCKDTKRCTAHSLRLESTIKHYNQPITVWYCQPGDASLADCAIDKR